jgi:hypothetical protein
MTFEQRILALLAAIEACPEVAPVIVKVAVVHYYRTMSCPQPHETISDGKGFGRVRFPAAYLALRNLVPHKLMDNHQVVIYETAGDLKFAVKFSDWSAYVGPAESITRIYE